MVNILVMEDNTRQPEQDGLKVLLKPDYYEKLKQEEAFDKLRNDIELTDEEKAAIDKWMSDPIRTSDSRIGHLVKDYWEHPERFKWFRDHVLFPTIEEKYFPDRVDDNPHDWRVEIPIISMDF